MTGPAQNLDGTAKVRKYGTAGAGLSATHGVLLAVKSKKGHSEMVDCGHAAG